MGDAPNPYNFGASQPRFVSPYVAPPAADYSNWLLGSIFSRSNTQTWDGTVCIGVHDQEPAAWAQRAFVEFAECSNRGHCDRTTGQCACMQGFTGEACSELTTFV